MVGPHDAEAPVVEGGHLGFIQHLAGGYDRCIHEAKPEVAVASSQLARAQEPAGSRLTSSRAIVCRRCSLNRRERDFPWTSWRSWGGRETQRASAETTQFEPLRDPATSPASEPGQVQPQRGRGRLQAIAKGETVSGNAARLGRSVHLCLCKTPGQDRLAALLLLVQGEARSRPATHSPRPLMRASCGVPVVAPDRAVHRAGLTGHATTSGRQEGRSSGTTPARGSRYATIWELNE